MSAPLHPKLLLASASPRRRDLLERIGVCFDVEPAEIEETLQDGESPETCAQRLAREKALHVARRAGSQPPRLVLAADTIVVLDGKALFKPVDEADAVRLLSQLVGRTHRVVTAVATLRSDSLAVREIRVESAVRMRAAKRAELEAYAATGEPLDKAGAYGLQGEGRRWPAGASDAGERTRPPV